MDTRTKSYLKAHSAVFMANFFYGINFVIAKDLLEHMPPMVVAFFRIFVSMGLLWFCGLFFRPDKIERRDMMLIALCGFLGVCINQSLLMKALSHTTPIDASIISTLSPLIVLGFSALLLKERVTWIKIAGIVTGCAGVLLLVLHDAQGVHIGTNLTGNLLMLLNMTIYGLYLVLIKPMMVKYDSLTVVKWLFLWGAIFYVPFSIGSVSTFSYSILPSYAWGSLAFVVIFTTLITYFLNLISMRTLTPTTVSMYLYIQPLTAGFMAIATGTDTLSVHKILSALLVFLGVYLMSMHNFRLAGRN